MRAREKGLSKVEERHKFLQGNLYKSTMNKAIMCYTTSQEGSLVDGFFAGFQKTFPSKSPNQVQIKNLSKFMQAMEPYLPCGVYVFLQVNYWRKKSTSLSKVFIEEKYAVADISFIVLYVVVSEDCVTGVEELPFPDQIFFPGAASPGEEGGPRTCS
ncbi:hypothetical protein D5086_020209 [Populus alba]|uniref:Uncharacterized protein n=1 Tax=Populus alba TaxID=43335 RepID=A0ACC4BJE7_POPAL